MIRHVLAGVVFISGFRVRSGLFFGLIVAF